MKPKPLDYCVFDSNEEARQAAIQMGFEINNPTEMFKEQYNVLYIVLEDTVYFTNEFNLLTSLRGRVTKKSKNEFMTGKSNGYLKHNFL